MCKNLTLAVHFFLQEYRFFFYIVSVFSLLARFSLVPCYLKGIGSVAAKINLWCMHVCLYYAEIVSNPLIRATRIPLAFSAYSGILYQQDIRTSMSILSTALENLG